MPELRISTAKVCDFIEAARELAGIGDADLPKYLGDALDAFGRPCD